MEQNIRDENAINCKYLECEKIRPRMCPPEDPEVRFYFCTEGGIKDILLLPMMTCRNCDKKVVKE